MTGVRLLRGVPWSGGVWATSWALPAVDGELLPLTEAREDPIFLNLFGYCGPGHSSYGHDVPTLFERSL